MPHGRIGKMGKSAKLLFLVLGGQSDRNLAFGDLCRLLLKLGFEQRIRGDHHIFSRAGVEEILNLQPFGGMAKPYQVKQVRQIVLKYKLGEIDADD